MLERFVAFGKSWRRIDYDRLKTGHWAVVALFLVPIAYALFITISASNHLGGLRSLEEPPVDHAEVFKALRRYILFTPLLGLPFLPAALRRMAFPTERASMVKLYFLYATGVMMVFITYLYLVVPFRPQF